MNDTHGKNKLLQPFTVCVGSHSAPYLNLSLSFLSDLLESFPLYILYNTVVKEPCGFLRQTRRTVCWICWLTLNIVSSVFVEVRNASRPLSPTKENVATLHFCTGSESPWGTEQTRFSSCRIRRAIPTFIIWKRTAGFDFTLLFYHWGLTLPRSVAAWAAHNSEVCYCLMRSNIISHHLRTGGPGRVIQECVCFTWSFRITLTAGI